jgi:hypothetical protein
MAKLIAIVNVVVWSGFWAFGYLALTAEHEGQMLTAVILAALGGAAGLWTWLWLARHAEEIGYAPRPRRAFPHNDDGHGETL